MDVMNDFFKPWRRLPNYGLIWKTDADIGAPRYHRIIAFWEYREDVEGPYNVAIERGYVELVEGTGWYLGNVNYEPPTYEPVRYERIIVRPTMKCWGRGLQYASAPDASRSIAEFAAESSTSPGMSGVS